MTFVDALPAFRMKQWQVIVLLFIEALSVCRIPALTPHMTNRRMLLQKVIPYILELGDNKVFILYARILFYVVLKRRIISYQPFPKRLNQLMSLEISLWKLKEYLMLNIKNLSSLEFWLHCNGSGMLRFIPLYFNFVNVESRLQFHIFGIRKVLTGLTGFVVG